MIEINNKKNSSLNDLQQEIINKFKEIGIEVNVGKPHLQRDNASLIIPNNDENKN